MNVKEANEMTKQELFDYVVSSVIEQGEPSRDGTWQCLYRGPNGLKCAAGFLIGDEEFDVTLLEGMSVFQFGFTEEDLICQLQVAHDSRMNSVDFIGAFKKECRHVAENYELNNSVCDTKGE